MTNTPQPTAPKSATITTEEALKLARAELLNITTAAWDDITYEDFYRWARNRAQFTLSATAPDKVAAHVAQQVPDARVDDLSALVVRLARQLNKAAPANSLPNLAMDYMRRNGWLRIGLRSDLRDTDAETKAIHEVLSAATGASHE